MVARLAICCTCGGLPLLAGIGAVTASTASALVVRLGLESQAPFDVPKDGSFTVVLDLPNIDLSTMPDTRLVITAYSPARSRTAIAEAVRRELPRTVDAVRFTLTALDAPAQGQVTISVPLESSTRTSAALQLSTAGVYPVLIELKNANDVLADLLTFVHRLPDETEREVALPVAFAMSTKSAVVLDDNNKVIIDDAVITEFSDLADLLEATSLPVAVRVPPLLLSGVAARGNAGEQLATRLATLMADNEALSAPRYPLDPSAAAAAGQQPLYTQWLRDGEDDIADAVGSQSSRALVFLDGQLSEGGASLLRDLGARLVVTTPQLYDELPRSIGGFTDLSQLVQLEVAPGVTLDAAVIDRTIAPVLTRRTSTPALTSIYVVADLLAYRQQIADSGGNPNRHAVTLGTPDLGLPNIDAFRAVGNLIASTSGLQPITLDTLGVRTDHNKIDNKAITVGLPPAVPGDVSGRVAIAAALGREGLSTASMLPINDPRIAQWTQSVTILPTQALTDAQVASTASDLRAQYSVVRSAVEVPAGFKFTLTGRKATVPIKLRNTGDVALTVRVRLTSSKLVFPDNATTGATAGDTTVELPPLSLTEVRVRIEARTNGRIPVTLRVLTPIGDLDLAPPVQLTASVFAFSGLGNLITGVLLLLVFTWWIRHLRQSRRRRSAAEALARHPGSGGASELEPGDSGLDDDLALSPDAATSTLPPL